MHFPLASIIMKYNQDWMSESGTHWINLIALNFIYEMKSKH